MKSLISYRFAAGGLLVILFLTVLFHGLILAGIIPFEIVWGGRLKTASDMRSFETVSIIINVLMLAIVLLHTGLWKVRVSQKITTSALWAITGLFLVNTIGNSLSLNELEKVVFTPLTLLLSLFSFRLAIGNGATEMKSVPQPRKVIP